VQLLARFVLLASTALLVHYPDPVPLVSIQKLELTTALGFQTVSMPQNSVYLLLAR
jgi:hypothetical protein